MLALLLSLVALGATPPAPPPPAVPAPEGADEGAAEAAARALLAQVNEARKRSDWVGARRLIADLQPFYPSTRAAESAQRILTEIAIVGAPAPAVAVTAWFTRPGSLTDARTTVLVFWEEWCPHSQQEVPKLPGIRARHAAQGVQVIALTRVTRSSTDAAVRDFVARHGLDAIAVGKDSAGAIAAAYPVQGIPAAAAVRDGRVIWRGHPAMLTEEVVATLAAD